MSDAYLTVLIPNYNRPEALLRTLESIFAAIDFAGSAGSVSVFVADDYSTADLTSVVARFQHRPEFRFGLQRSRCANAEKAFFTALQQVESRYTWLVGNDDVMLIDAIARLLPIIQSNRFGFALLNPQLRHPMTGVEWRPLVSSSPTVVYERTRELFQDFGFVTSTTTFPCLILRTSPVNDFYRRVKLHDAATVYSHSFGIFGALHEEPGVFFNHPTVAFTMSDPEEEHTKLALQTPRLAFHHQSLGLARLVQKTAESTGASRSLIVNASEDEVNKTSGVILPTTLGHFICYFGLEQMVLGSTASGDPSGRNFDGPEVLQIAEVLSHSADPGVIRVFRSAFEISISPELEPDWKAACLRAMQQELRRAGAVTYAQIAPQPSPAVPVKLHLPNLDSVFLRGRKGDHLGRPI